MNPALFLSCFLPILVMVLLWQQERLHIHLKMAQRKRKKGSGFMQELIKEYMGKECLVYTLNSQLTGTVTEVADGWLRLSGAGGEDTVNLDYRVRIREYPRNKKGKKKSIVVD